ncbi:MAG: hypothetical protein ACRDYU_11995 [Actinomycetes bacterium]
MDRLPPPGGLHGPEFGGIVLGWLAKITIALLVLGVLAFDALSVVVNEVGVQDEAGQAATAASEVYAEVHDARPAYDAAVAALNTETSVIIPGSFSVAADASVSLRVERTAPSLVLHRTDRTADLARVTGEATRRYVG